MRHARIASFLLFFAAAAHAADVTTIAGHPGVPGWWDGPVSDALFAHPTWLDVVSGRGPSNGCDDFTPGDIYVIDRINQLVRRIDGAGNVTTIPLDVRTFYPPVAAVPNFGGAFGGGILIEPPGAGCGCGEYARGMFLAGTGTHQVELFAPRGDLGLRDGDIIIGTAGQTGSTDGDFSLFNAPTGVGRSWKYTGSISIDKAQALYIADTGNHTIRYTPFVLSAEACPQNRRAFTLAGLAGVAGSADGKGSDARFNTPRGVAGAPDGSVYVTDSGNHTIRRILPDGTVTTVAGEAGVAGSNDGPALQAHLNTPTGIDVNEKGEVFIADTFNHTIRELTTDGHLVTIAGMPGVSGFKDGDAATALFNAPVGLKIAPDGTIVIADTSNNVIRRLSR